MAAVKLTPTQEEILACVAQGYTLHEYPKSIPQMVSRGLIVGQTETASYLKQAKRLNESWYNTVPVTRYYLTELGFEVYSKILERRHVRVMKDLRMEHSETILRAKSRILPSEKPL